MAVPPDYSLFTDTVFPQEDITNTAGTVTPAQVENQNLVIATPTAFAGGDGTALLTVDYLILPCA